MTDTPAIPGGFVSFVEAQAALAESAQLQMLAADAKMRLERALTLLNETLTQIACARKDALSAIDLFAEITPGQLATPPRDYPVRVAEIVALSQDIVHDTEDVVETIETFLRSVRGEQS